MSTFVHAAFMVPMGCPTLEGNWFMTQKGTEVRIGHCA